MNHNPPKKTELEITIIGTGGGYGESAVIHLGNGDWIVIDSCINPHTKIPLPLEYLQLINVNVETSVKLIICTHWHDDHIQGISKIVEASPNAKFCMAKVHDRGKFLHFVSLDYKKLEKVASNTSTEEFNKCLDIISKRATNFKHASADKTLFAKNQDGKEIQVISLSPSDQAINNFDSEISTLITNYGETRKKIVIDDPNDKSVAILIKAGGHRALLGADLEVSNDENTGWKDILNNSQCIDKKATYFKIPHHGSENGYHPQIWVQLLESNATSSLTPWNRNRGLPELKMLKTYCDHSQQLYMTSPRLIEKPKKRDKDIQKIIQNLNYKLTEVKFSKGCICSRIDIFNDTDFWTTSLIDSAFKVEP